VEIGFRKEEIRINDKNASYVKYEVFFMRKIFTALCLAALLSGCARENNEAIYPSESESEAYDFTVYTTQEEEKLPNKTIGWGMRRNPPEPPVFTDEQVSMMEKYGCIYKGSDEKKYLYLTFDEGYENGQTEKILDTLKEKGVTAAFFITGDYFKRERVIVDRMVEENHIVGNHTMNHPSIPSLESVQNIEEEVLSLDRAFYAVYKTHMRYFRAPKGEYSEKSLAVTESLGYVNTFWSFAYDDWYRDKQRGEEYAYKKTMENLHNGCVLLLHAVSEDNASALGRIIDDARSMGYEFKSLDEYIGDAENA
jgi:peptidoglycan-N-acetylmuramic acid deacetylase